METHLLQSYNETCSSFTIEWKAGNVEILGMLVFILWIWKSCECCVLLAVLDINQIAWRMCKIILPCMTCTNSDQSDSLHALCLWQNQRKSGFGLWVASPMCSSSQSLWECHGKMMAVWVIQQFDFPQSKMTV